MAGHEVVDKNVHESGCAAAIAPRVYPSGDNPTVIFSHTACRFEVEAYAVNPVEAEGYSMSVLANASAFELAPGPLPGAGIRGFHFTIYRGNSGGV